MALKKRLTVCRELISLCDILSIDISFRKNSVIAIIEETSFKSLSFITAQSIKQEGAVESPLRDDENTELSRFLYSLGKSDTSSQLRLIEGFRQYITLREEEYRNKLEKDSRLYIALGIFSGAIISLIFI